jgi:hypothetical protein
MQIILIILLVGAALATLFVLIKGVIGLANNQTPERSQELMRKRILYQAIAILLAVLLLLTFGTR